MPSVRKKVVYEIIDTRLNTKTHYSTAETAYHDVALRLISQKYWKNKLPAEYDVHKLVTRFARWLQWKDSVKPYKRPSARRLSKENGAVWDVPRQVWVCRNCGSRASKLGKEELSRLFVTEKTERWKCRACGMYFIIDKTGD